MNPFRVQMKRSHRFRIHMKRSYETVTLVSCPHETVTHMKPLQVWPFYVDWNRCERFMWVWNSHMKNTWNRSMKNTTWTLTWKLYSKYFSDDSFSYVTTVSCPQETVPSVKLFETVTSVYMKPSYEMIVHHTYRLCVHMKRSHRFDVHMKRSHVSKWFD